MNPDKTREVHITLTGEDLEMMREILQAHVQFRGVGQLHMEDLLAIEAAQPCRARPIGKRKEAVQAQPERRTANLGNELCCIKLAGQGARPW